MSATKNLHLHVEIVRVTDDGSYTYKGPYATIENAKYEAEAWADAFPTYLVTVRADNALTKERLRGFNRAIIGGERYFCRDLHAFRLSMDDVVKVLATIDEAHENGASQPTMCREAYRAIGCKSHELRDIELRWIDQVVDHQLNGREMRVPDRAEGRR